MATACRKTTRLVVTDHAWRYLKTQIVFGELPTGAPTSPTISLVQFRVLLAQQCQELYGLAGSGIQVDVLGYDEEQGTGLLRVATSDFNAVWSAMSLATPCKVENRQCIIRVLGTSASLMALASNSRTAQWLS
ncbi:hypothetical protein THASP1DRAFT_31977 [Thamnocephalis sphaerospora]|uniref:Uncharacterized protein n=1 Tax=Thamnocephalis sphaerospora TaxID=78915 RepID=A0A4P9XLG9_9FUNG|nr:hypothetical protein THASP1DRAFT_31977 [Thamnocephalis sphaerospora]|eukprot:RKP06201.1 hypothetical protein THASP1DRAFT_31977 [Thamnocephalis sphaerospora]